MSEPRQALEHLQIGARTDLADVCGRFGVDLLVAFGSAVRPETDPHDLDLAVRFRAADPDVLGFLDALTMLSGSSEIDLMDLGRAGPVARERALVGGVPLYQGQPGAFARAQMAAVTQRMDTEWLRRMELELMAR
jgi:predicted nucleotidyltransferase